MSGRPTRQHSCPPDHSHGQSETCYLQHKCGCAVCRENHAYNMRARRKEQAYGRYNRAFVDVEPVREHINWLRSQGMGPVYIAAASGVPKETIQRMLWGKPILGEAPSKKCKATTAAKILATQPDLNNLGAGASIDARGTARRIHALYRIGYSYEAMSRHLGLSSNTMHRVSKAPRVVAGTARKVRDMYDELWDKPVQPQTAYQRATVAKTINKAKRNRWVGPLGWDDIDLDPAPPTVEVDDEPFTDHVAIERALRGDRVKLTSLERREAVRIAHNRRWSDQVTAERLHLTDRSVLRIREELGLAAWDMAEMRTLRHVHSEGVAA